MFGVSGLMLGVQCLGFRVLCLGFRAYLGFNLSGLWFRV